MVVSRADVSRDDVHSRPLAGLEPALAADDLIAPVLEFSHRDWLDQTECPDGIRQFFQRLVVECHTRLVWVRLDQIHRNPQHITIVLLRLGACDLLINIPDRLPFRSDCLDVSQKGAEPFAQPAFLLIVAAHCKFLSQVLCLLLFLVLLQHFLGEVHVVGRSVADHIIQYDRLAVRRRFAEADAPLNHCAKHHVLEMLL